MAALLAIAGACTASPPAVATPTPTAESGALDVTVLVDLSGTRATSVGNAERNAVQLWLDQHQGKTRYPVRAHVVDVAGSDAKLLVELRSAAVDAQTDAVVVAAPVTLDDTLGRALDAAALPVLFTLPLAADPAGGSGGRWAFSLAPLLSRVAQAEVQDSVLRGTLSPSLLLTDSRETIDPTATALESALRARGLDALTRIAMPADASVPPVVRSSLSVLRSVHCTAQPSACAPVAQMAQSGATPTFFYLSYLATPRDLADHRELAARAIWPSSRTVLPFDAPPVTAENQARAAFLRSYADRYGAPSVHAAAAFDALSLLLAAAERASPDDRSALRRSLEGITMPLIATTYTFAPDRHAGSDPDDVTYVRWTGSQVAPALAPTLGTGIATPMPSPTASPRASATASPTGGAASASPSP